MGDSRPDLSKLKRTVKQWAHIITVLTQFYPNEIVTRDTDHEFRTDDRDIIKWHGKKVWMSVDGLPYNIERDKKFIIWALSAYSRIPESWIGQ